MSPSPSSLQWITAFALLILFSWVLLSLFWNIVPAPWVNPDKPQKRIFGIALLSVMGLLGYSFTREVMMWVWMGIRHLLGLDLEGI